VGPLSENLSTYDHISLSFSYTREMFQTEVIKKIPMQILRSVTFFRKACRSWDNVENDCRARQDTKDNTIRRTACWVTKATDLHS